MAAFEVLEAAFEVLEAEFEVLEAEFEVLEAEFEALVVGSGTVVLSLEEHMMGHGFQGSNALPLAEDDICK